MLTLNFSRAALAAFTLDAAISYFEPWTKKVL